MRDPDFKAALRGVCDEVKTERMAQGLLGRRHAFDPDVLVAWLSVFVTICHLGVDIVGGLEDLIGIVRRVIDEIKRRRAEKSDENEGGEGVPDGER